ncbi:hypothetical protein QFZ73_001581 [Peribacillus sp. V2I11]|nr:hypothetical protein [Peribacillus sp. V2I11]
MERNFHSAYRKKILKVSLALKEWTFVSRTMIIKEFVGFDVVDIKKYNEKFLKFITE